MKARADKTTAPPLKGGFFSLWPFGSGVSIHNEYQHNKATNDMLAHWSYRDKWAWEDERKSFVERAYDIRIDDARYIVVNNTNISEKDVLRVMVAYHTGKTKKVLLNE